MTWVFSLGGDKRDRTADPLLAKQVLSQLSYTPVYLGSAVVSCLSDSDTRVFLVSGFVQSRFSSNNFHSSNQFRSLRELLSSVLAGRYSRA